MLCKQIIKSFHAIIGAGLLASVFMIFSSQAAGESNCWMEEQLTLTDGGSPYFGCAVREQGVEARRAESQAAAESNCWMEEQLTLTDGGSPYFGCAVREQGVGARRADTIEHSVAKPDKEDGFLDRQFRMAGG